MRKIILAVLLSLVAVPAYSTGCTIANVIVKDGGNFGASDSAVVTFTGPGAGGATAYANLISSDGVRWYISSIYVASGGNYSGPATVFITGSTYGNNGTWYVVMGGSCPGGGGNRGAYSWLM
jgi:hypothetical protein